MKRKESYFGLHFDYHANKDTRDIGIRFDEAVVERIVREVKPDFIQCDTKGQPGYASYRTALGNAAPHLMKDILRGWRKVTKKYGVALYSHYSGIWDNKAMTEHPEWAAVTADGTVTDKASVFGGYADNVLIPQLNELAETCGMDGAWVDGECWALPVDYSEAAQKAYKEATGKSAPREKDEDYKEYLDFQRKAFFAYVKRYIEEVKKENPNFEITSNWLNTSWTPDDIEITDYISGDLAAINSVDSARFDGRIMQMFGRNWDIMSWGISLPVHCVKSAAQLCQEAAIILSLGGGFQVYNMQSPQNTVMDEWAIPIWAEVARFCRERQAYCHNAEIVPDVGVLYSPAAYYDGKKELFMRDDEYNLELYGMLTALCDCGKSVSVFSAERMLRGAVSLDAYKSVVVTNCTALEQGVKERLLAYVEQGGNLVICGSDATRLFAEEFRIESAACDAQPVAVLYGDDYAVEIRRPYRKITAGSYQTAVNMHECTVDGDLACINPPPSIEVHEESIPAFVTVKRGKGEACFMPIDVGRTYFERNSFELKRFFRDCFAGRDLGRVRINKNGEADVLLTRKNGKEYLHVINLLGEHRSERIKTFDFIPSVRDVEITYASCAKPKRVVLRPSGEKADYEYKDGTLTVRLDKVEIHAITEIEYEG